MDKKKFKSLDEVIEEEDIKNPGFKKKVEFLFNIEMLGLKLQKIRKETGLNQKELAKKLNVSQQRISDIENSGNVTVKSLIEYLDSLGYKIDFKIEKVL